MTIWLFRAGSSGEFEEKFLNDSRVYLTWNDLNKDLRQYPDQKSLKEYLMKHSF